MRSQGDPSVFLDERDASVTRRRLVSRSSVEQAPMSPLFLSPNPPIVCLTLGRFRADFLFGVRVALIGSRSARYFSPTCSPRARMSALMTCHLLWTPLRHLRPLPSSPAGFWSTATGFRTVVCCLCIDLLDFSPNPKSSKVTFSAQDLYTCRRRKGHCSGEIRHSHPRELHLT